LKLNQSITPLFLVPALVLKENLLAGCPVTHPTISLQMIEIREGKAPQHTDVNILNLALADNLRGYI